MIKTKAWRGKRKHARNCKKKKQLTEQAAQFKSKAYKLQGKEINYYQCDVCGHYHLTSKPQYVIDAANNFYDNIRINEELRELLTDEPTTD